MRDAGMQLAHGGLTHRRPQTPGNWHIHLQYSVCYRLQAFLYGSVSQPVFNRGIEGILPKYIQWMVHCSYTKYLSITVIYSIVITGPPTHSVGGQTSNGRWCLSSSSSSWSVTLHCKPAGGFTCTNKAMTSCRLQSNYSSTATRWASCVTYW